MIGILAAMAVLTLAACGGTTSTGNGGSSSKLRVAFMPKQINNPYFDTAAAGGKKAAQELSRTFTKVGP